ncbi:MAG: response regulator [Ignavibacteria bacterium]|nr:response regulator [Ignavibacteria bacterium]
MKRVLVVDDNLINLKLACDILESENFEVIRATSADEAIAILEEAIPDLVLLDIGMPGMDGYMLTRKLKSLEKTRDLKIVALTASAMKGDDVKAYEAGFDGYLTKPIDTRNFASSVSKFINSEKSNKRYKK